MYLNMHFKMLCHFKMHVKMGHFYVHLKKDYIKIAPRL